MSEFSNLSVNLNEIPDFKSIDLQGVDVTFKNILIVRYSIGIILTAVVLSLSIYYLPVPEWIQVTAIILAIMIFFLVFLEFFKGFPLRKYGVRELDIIFQSGYFVKRETIIPFSRIQHVEISQGLLLRKFELYNLLIYTAGESSGDLKIAGLDFFTAQKVKSKVLQEIEDE